MTVPLKLLLDLKDELGLTYLFITHDLATAQVMCDRVGILYLGQLVEVGEAGDKPLPKGEIPDAVRPPAGCRFHPR